MYSFANLNMAASPMAGSGLVAACRLVEGAGTPWLGLQAFLAGYSSKNPLGSRAVYSSVPRPASLDAPGACYNMSLQLPSGAHADTQLP